MIFINSRSDSSSGVSAKSISYREETVAAAQPSYRGTIEQRKGI
jgi:hypothetical protein